MGEPSHQTESPGLEINRERVCLVKERGVYVCVCVREREREREKERKTTDRQTESRKGTDLSSCIWLTIIQ